MAEVLMELVLAVETNAPLSVYDHKFVDPIYLTAVSIGFSYSQGTPTVHVFTATLLSASTPTPADTQQYKSDNMDICRFLLVVTISPM